VIALTNNFSGIGPSIPPSELAFLGWQDGATPMRVRALFDDFCDSSELGSRYALAFLALLCVNLKAQKT
jgi:hypothetical protein